MISAKEIVKNSRNRAPVPEALLGKVRALDQTAAASGDVNGEVKLVDSKGKTVGGANAEGEGFSVDPKQSRFSPLSLVQGRWAAGPHEVVIDDYTATKHHYEVGDTIGAKAEKPVR